jgi:transcriptional regulator with XRE-family HTH domain
MQTSENASVTQIMAFSTKKATRKAGTDLGRVIRSIRLRENRGQAEFAQSHGWPQATLSQYESGDARPSAERLIALLRLTATDDERGPILKALEACGVLASDLNRTLLISPEQFSPHAEGRAGA